MLNIFVGFDPKESIAFHVCVNSIIEHSSKPVKIIPLCVSNINCYNETHTDGTNSFVYLRFLVPHLMEYKGWSIYIDSDVILKTDINNAEQYFLYDYACAVVKHNYTTKFNKKYLNNNNINYPKKNWSSVILWNCSHPKNQTLTPELVENSEGSFLHRFSWLDDKEIFGLPLEWNWLVEEYPFKNNINLLHYTLGIPAFKDYENSMYSNDWNEQLKKTLVPLK
jgi:lipopolysaccharide biosynthesis glycosyltransferase